MAPLLKPSECSVVIVERLSDACVPDDNDSVAVGGSRILEAAALCRLPALFAAPNHSRPEQVATTAKPGPINVPIHDLLPTASWADSTLGLALAATNRSSVLICGYWLDEAVTFTSLHALGEGYDVYLLTDASPPLEADGRRAAILRLVQAGIVPTTTKQAIREWAADTIDPSLRAKLLALV